MVVPRRERRRPGRPRVENSETDTYEVKRRAVLDAAARLFMKHSFAATSVREIAREANISMATLYHYFSSKDKILSGIHNMMAAELLPMLRNVLVSEVNHGEKLKQCIRIEMQLIENHPTHTVAFRRERRALRPDDAEEMKMKRDEADHIIDTILSDGVQDGTFRPIDIKLTRLAITGMANHSVEWYDPKGPASITEIADTFADLILRSLTARDCPPQLSE